MLKLVVPPDQAGYSVLDGTEVLRQQLDGGMGRYRVDILNATRTVNCKWTVGPYDYQYLRSFYNVVNATAATFLIDLYLDAPVLTEHEAKFLPGTMQLAENKGMSFTVSCQMEVTPIDTSEFDAAFIELLAIYGSRQNVSEILNLLEKLVNVDLPEIA